MLRLSPLILLLITATIAELGGQWSCETVGRKRAAVSVNLSAVSVDLSAVSVDLSTMSVDLSTMTGRLATIGTQVPDRRKMREGLGGQSFENEILRVVC